MAIAAPREFDAVTAGLGIDRARPRLWERISGDHGFDLVLTGVGKANASGATGRAIDPKRHLGVLSVGIAGALPGSGCTLGDVLCASSSIFGDEGVVGDRGFESCAQMGFAPFENQTDSIEHDPSVIRWLEPCCDRTGVIATVSTCSGTDLAAETIAERTGALGEAMEGAAVALAAKRVDPSLLTGEVRVISNTTGERTAQRWDLDGALEKLSAVLGRIAERPR